MADQLKAAPGTLSEAEILELARDLGLFQIHDNATPSKEIILEFAELLAAAGNSQSQDAITKLRAALEPFAKAFWQERHSEVHEPAYRAFLDRNTITPQMTVGPFRIANEVFFDTAAIAAMGKQEGANHGA